MTTAHSSHASGASSHAHDDEDKRPALLLAEYDSTAAVIHAAQKVRDAGYTVWDTHTPFPIHGMDAAMGLPDSRLGWIVLGMALTGLSSAVIMIQWMNGHDYQLVVGGKPPDAYASMVPIMFELTILFSAFGAVFGMFGLNQLPRHHHAVFESERFRAMSDDRYFLSIEASDKKFSVEKTRSLLEATHPVAVELIEEEVS